MKMRKLRSSTPRASARGSALVTVDFICRRLYVVRQSIPVGEIPHIWSRTYRPAEFRQAARYFSPSGSGRTRSRVRDLLPEEHAHEDSREDGRKRGLQYGFHDKSVAHRGNRFRPPATRINVSVAEGVTSLSIDSGGGGGIRTHGPR